MALFQKGNKLGGRPKGVKNKVNKDIRQVFHDVYEAMGANQLDPTTGKPVTGPQAMLFWARDNPTEFYRLYGKMIPTKEEPKDEYDHDAFIDELVLEDEIKLVEAKDVTEVGSEAQIQLLSGEVITDNAPSPKNDADVV